MVLTPWLIIPQTTLPMMKAISTTKKTPPKLTLLKNLDAFLDKEIPKTCYQLHYIRSVMKTS